VTTILLANDMRDLEEDRAEGKATAVTLWGRSFGRVLWIGLVVAAFAFVVVWILLRPRSLALLTVVVAVPHAVAAWKALWRGRDRETLALGLRRTAGLHLAFGFLLSLGLLLRT
jgi:1,4-dihydroxy-2-naphthoate octaprenyltransferase